jgi:hypothetical protein
VSYAELVLEGAGLLFDLVVHEGHHYLLVVPEVVLDELVELRLLQLFLLQLLLLLR